MRHELNLKVCGMRDAENIRQVGALAPDFMGFIFYNGSPRYVGPDFAIPDSLPARIKRVGVFVNESTDEIIATDVINHSTVPGLPEGREGAKRTFELLRRAVGSGRLPAETQAVLSDAAVLGRSFSLRDLQALPASNNFPSPCPRLVTLGTHDGQRELVNLGEAGGVARAAAGAGGAQPVLRAASCHFNRRATKSVAATSTKSQKARCTRWRRSERSAASSSQRTPKSTSAPKKQAA